MKISVVSPIYMGEKLVLELVLRLKTTICQLTNDFEIILVEDGSPDFSWSVIEKICQDHSEVKGIKLSRNFGQHYAITCGLESATGEWIVIMDCDLQDQPEEIPSLYNKAIEGFDVVLAQRVDRQDHIIKKYTSALFYKVLSYMTDTKQDASVANFGIYHKNVISAILSMNDYIRYLPTMVQWVGFNSTKIGVQHSSRAEGKSSYTIGKLIKLAVNNIISFSDKPLRILVRFGLILSLFSFLFGAYYLYKYFNNEIHMLGYTSIILTITFLSGMIIFTLGLVGIYVGKTFEQSKQRPSFIIHKTLNID